MLAQKVGEHMHSGAPILVKKGTMHTDMGLYTHELVKKLEGDVPPVPPAATKPELKTWGGNDKRRAKPVT